MYFFLIKAVFHYSSLIIVFLQNKIRERTSIALNTAKESVFVVKKYATALTNLALNRDIIINYCTDLIEVRPSGALFQGGGGQVK